MSNAKSKARSEVTRGGARVKRVRKGVLVILVGGMLLSLRSSSDLTSSMLTPPAKVVSPAATARAWVRVTKAPKRARETRAADPMANPFPMAAVVFPAASRASVYDERSESRKGLVEERSDEQKGC